MRRKRKSSLLIALSIFCGINGFCLAVSADAEDSYPHITQLETYILGQTFVGEPLPQRLSRMEQKAFGKASTDPDLSARSDALDDYSEKKLGKHIADAIRDMPDDSDALVNTDAPAAAVAPVSAPSGGGEMTPMLAPVEPQTAATDYPHIDTLEKEILGQTYKQDALPDRIARMEEKAFGAPSSDPDLTNRTDALDDYTQKKLHAKSFDKQQAEQAAREGYLPAAGGGGGANGGTAASRGKQVLSFLGSQLLGMAIPVPGLANTLIGGRAIPASSMPQATQEVVDRPRQAEDPAVFEPTPPPPNARMITQVGWCEMQVFGHTSPQLHISERLEQLNLELKFAPGQKGTELMDDVPQLMNAVKAKVASTPANATH